LKKKIFIVFNRETAHKLQTDVGIKILELKVLETLPSNQRSICAQQNDTKWNAYFIDHTHSALFGYGLG